jgi:hypothetical protein
MLDSFEIVLARCGQTATFRNISTASGTKYYQLFLKAKEVKVLPVTGQGGI